jgi:hypothetical protein
MSLVSMHSYVEKNNQVQITWYLIGRTVGRSQ